mgnify:CR=1 FL=1
MFHLLSTANPKTLKGEKKGYLTFILHLAPADLSGHEVCPKRTAGCTATCLNTAGRGGMFRRGETTNVIQEARKRRTRVFFHNRDLFMHLLTGDIKKAIRYADARGFTAAFRLNGTSDLSWEKYACDGARNVFERFPNVQFYDYTKVPHRKTAHIPNYHLTFSLAEDNVEDANWAIKNGMNVAVVFDRLPETYLGCTVINGDETDLRFLDPPGVIVGLKAKGRAKKDVTGFVKRLDTISKWQYSTHIEA